MGIRRTIFVVFSSIILLALLLAAIYAHRRADRGGAAPRSPQAWHEYYEAEHDARIYVGTADGTVQALACVYIAEIDATCSLRLEHDCTAEQFERLREILREKGLEYRGTVSEPDTEGYPDLSPYIPFVLSSDERHELWRELGLEEEP